MFEGICASNSSLASLLFLMKHPLPFCWMLWSIWKFESRTESVRGNKQYWESKISPLDWDPKDPENFTDLWSFAPIFWQSPVEDSTSAVLHGLNPAGWWVKSVPFFFSFCWPFFCWIQLIGRPKNHHNSQAKMVTPTVIIFRDFLGRFLWWTHPIIWRHSYQNSTMLGPQFFARHESRQALLMLQS